MERPIAETKLPRKSGRELKNRCGKRKTEGTIVVPLVVGLVPIGVQPATLIVAVHVEHVRVAVEVRFV